MSALRRAEQSEAISQTKGRREGAIPHLLQLEGWEAEPGLTTPGAQAAWGNEPGLWAPVLVFVYMALSVSSPPPCEFFIAVCSTCTRLTHECQMSSSMGAWAISLHWYLSISTLERRRSLKVTFSRYCALCWCVICLFPCNSSWRG